MDQVKEILKQAIKYRFWIALGISLLVPAIAYALGSGPIKEEAAKKTTEIEGAKKEVEQYSSGVVPNKEYKPLVERQTVALSKDVRNAWQKLYDRQAPLLTWPERVQERFTTWGRRWPEAEDASRVQFAIIDYVQAYPKFVTEVYNTFRPFDYAEGTGIVAAPPEATLLRPAPFNENTPPDLGKVWAAQERLWIQGALLNVIAEVNKSAKTWDAATIKQIKALEVGSPAAQDQVSMANNETLAEAEAITDPKAPPPAEPAAADSTMPGMAGMSTMSGPQQKPDLVYYLANAAGAAAPYKIMPVEMAVLIEQDRIQDFLSALENSPMSIQVKEFAMSRPGERVVKPEKGQSHSAFGYEGMYGGGLMSPGMGRAPMTMYGGGAMMQRMPGAAGYGGLGGGSAKGGVDKRSVDRRKKGADGKEEEETEKTKKTSTQDPYFNVVEVTFYGQVRFYNPPPPPEPAAEPTSESPGEKAADGEAKPKDEAAKSDEKPENAPAPEGEMKKEGEAPAEKDDAAAKKDEGDAAKEKDEGDAAKKDDAAKDKEPDAKPEEPAAKEKKADAPKGEAAAKDEAPKKDAGSPGSKP